MAAKFKGHIKTCTFTQDVHAYSFIQPNVLSNDGAVSVTLTRNKVGGGMLYHNPVKY